ncbi:hypothetical protein F5Y19DRAFT_469303 [Xylariaceae sp. FL1651]|nr:hypothetical protein F5Y19DRAFT_469303 [Xylariaceae sp. FL1651]
MIGDRGTGFAEHQLIPVLKLIDFGRAQQSQGEFERMVYELCLNSAFLITGTHSRIVTRAIDIRHRHETDCPDGNGAAYPTLDDSLRHFLARCTARDKTFRPSLERMLAEAERGAAKPAQAYGPNEHLESDAAIGELLARLLFDADPTTDSGGLSSSGDDLGLITDSSGRAKKQARIVSNV